MVVHFHLRRIGRLASQSEFVDCANFIDLLKTVIIVGRSTEDSDYVLRSQTVRNNIIISRRHARIVLTRDCYKIHDDSLNGVFVNDVKISGPTILEEGDTVVFGHPTGAEIKPGERVRQPDSEYQYLFERCSCLSPGIDMQRRLQALPAPRFPDVDGGHPSQNLRAIEGPNTTQQIVRTVTASQTSRQGDHDQFYRYESSQVQISVPAPPNSDTIRTPDNRALPPSRCITTAGAVTSTEIRGLRQMLPLYTASSMCTPRTTRSTPHIPVAHSSNSLVVQVDMPQDLSRSAPRTPTPEDLSVTRWYDSVTTPQNMNSVPVIPVMEFRHDNSHDIVDDNDVVDGEPEQFVRLTSQKMTKTVKPDLPAVTTDLRRSSKQSVGATDSRCDLKGPDKAFDSAHVLVSNKKAEKPSDVSEFTTLHVSNEAAELHSHADVPKEDTVLSKKTAKKSEELAKSSSEEEEPFTECQETASSPTANEAHMDVSDGGDAIAADSVGQHASRVIASPELFHEEGTASVTNKLTGNVEGNVVRETDSDVQLEPSGATVCEVPAVIDNAIPMNRDKCDPVPSCDDLLDFKESMNSGAAVNVSENVEVELNVNNNNPEVPENVEDLSEPQLFPQKQDKNSEVEESIADNRETTMEVSHGTEAESDVTLTAVDRDDCQRTEVAGLSDRDNEVDKKISVGDSAEITATEDENKVPLEHTKSDCQGTPEVAEMPKDRGNEVNSEIPVSDSAAVTAVEDENKLSLEQTETVSKEDSSRDSERFKDGEKIVRIDDQVGIGATASVNGVLLEQTETINEEESSPNCHRDEDVEIDGQVNTGASAQMMATVGVNEVSLEQTETVNEEKNTPQSEAPVTTEKTVTPDIPVDEMNTELTAAQSTLTTNEEDRDFSFEQTETIADEESNDAIASQTTLTAVDIEIKDGDVSFEHTEMLTDEDSCAGSQNTLTGVEKDSEEGFEATETIADVSLPGSQKTATFLDNLDSQDLTASGETRTETGSLEQDISAVNDESLPSSQRTATFLDDVNSADLRGSDETKTETRSLEQTISDVNDYRAKLDSASSSVTNDEDSESQAGTINLFTSEDEEQTVVGEENSSTHSSDNETGTGSRLDAEDMTENVGEPGNSGADTKEEIVTAEVTQHENSENLVGDHLAMLQNSGTIVVKDIGDTLVTEIKKFSPQGTAPENAIEEVDTEILAEDMGCAEEDGNTCGNQGDHPDTLEGECSNTETGLDKESMDSSQENRKDPSTFANNETREDTSQDEVIDPSTETEEENAENQDLSGATDSSHSPVRRSSLLCEKENSHDCTYVYKEVSLEESAEEETEFKSDHFGELSENESKEESENASADVQESVLPGDIEELEAEIGDIEKLEAETGDIEELEAETENAGSESSQDKVESGTDSVIEAQKQDGVEPLSTDEKHTSATGTPEDSAWEQGVCQHSECVDEMTMNTATTTGDAPVTTSASDRSETEAQTSAEEKDEITEVAEAESRKDESSSNNDNLQASERFEAQTPAKENNEITDVAEVESRKDKGSCDNDNFPEEHLTEDVTPQEKSALDVNESSLNVVPSETSVVTEGLAAPICSEEKVLNAESKKMNDQVVEEVEETKSESEAEQEMIDEEHTVVAEVFEADEEEAEDGFELELELSQWACSQASDPKEPKEVAESTESEEDGQHDTVVMVEIEDRDKALDVVIIGLEDNDEALDDVQPTSESLPSHDSDLDDQKCNTDGNIECSTTCEDKNRRGNLVVAGDFDKEVDPVEESMDSPPENGKEPPTFADDETREDTPQDDVCNTPCEDIRNREGNIVVTSTKEVIDPTEENLSSSLENRKDPVASAYNETNENTPQENVSTEQEESLVTEDREDWEGTDRPQEKEERIASANELSKDDTTENSLASTLEEFTTNFECLSSGDEVNDSDDDEVLAEALPPSDTDSAPSSQVTKCHASQQVEVCDVLESCESSSLSQSLLLEKTELIDCRDKLADEGSEVDQTSLASSCRSLTNELVASGEDLDKGTEKTESAAAVVLVDASDVVEEPESSDKVWFSPQAKTEMSEGRNALDVTSEPGVDTSETTVLSDSPDDEDDTVTCELDDSTTSVITDAVTSTEAAKSDVKQTLKRPRSSSDDSVIILSSDESYQPAKVLRRESNDVVFIKEEIEESAVPKSQTGTSTEESIIIDSDDDEAIYVDATTGNCGDSGPPAEIKDESSEECVSKGIEAQSVQSEPSVHVAETEESEVSSQEDVLSTSHDTLESECVEVCSESSEVESPVKKAATKNSQRSKDDANSQIEVEDTCPKLSGAEFSKPDQIESGRAPNEDLRVSKSSQSETEVDNSAETSSDLKVVSVGDADDSDDPMEENQDNETSQDEGITVIESVRTLNVSDDGPPPLISNEGDSQESSKSDSVNSECDQKSGNSDIQYTNECQANRTSRGSQIDALISEEKADSANEQSYQTDDDDDDMLLQLEPSQACDDIEEDNISSSHEELDSCAESLSETVAEMYQEMMDNDHEARVADASSAEVPTEVSGQHETKADSNDASAAMESAEVSQGESQELACLEEENITVLADDQNVTVVADNQTVTVADKLADVPDDQQIEISDEDSNNSPSPKEDVDSKSVDISDVQVGDAKVQSTAADNSCQQFMADTGYAPLSSAHATEKTQSDMVEEQEQSIVSSNCQAVEVEDNLPESIDLEDDTAESESDEDIHLELEPSQHYHEAVTVSSDDENLVHCEDQIERQVLEDDMIVEELDSGEDKTVTDVEDKINMEDEMDSGEDKSVTNVEDKMITEDVFHSGEDKSDVDVESESVMKDKLGSGEDKPVDVPEETEEKETGRKMVDINTFENSDADVQRSSIADEQPSFSNLQSLDLFSEAASSQEDLSESQSSSCDVSQPDDIPSATSSESLDAQIAEETKVQSHLESQSGTVVDEDDGHTCAEGSEQAFDKTASDTTVILKDSSAANKKSTEEGPLEAESVPEVCTEGEEVMPETSMSGDSGNIAPDSKDHLFESVAVASEKHDEISDFEMKATDTELSSNTMTGDLGSTSDVDGAAVPEKDQQLSQTSSSLAENVSTDEKTAEEVTQDVRNDESAKSGPHDTPLASSDNQPEFLEPQQVMDASEAIETRLDSSQTLTEDEDMESQSTEQSDDLLLVFDMSGDDINLSQSQSTHNQSCSQESFHSANSRLEEHEFVNVIIEDLISEAVKIARQKCETQTVMTMVSTDNLPLGSKEDDAKTMLGSTTSEAHTVIEGKPGKATERSQESGHLLDDLVSAEVKPSEDCMNTESENNSEVPESSHMQSLNSCSVVPSVYSEPDKSVHLETLEEHSNSEECRDESEDQERVTNSRAPVVGDCGEAGVAKFPECEPTVDQDLAELVESNNTESDNICKDKDVAATKHPDPVSVSEDVKTDTEPFDNDDTMSLESCDIPNDDTISMVVAGSTKKKENSDLDSVRLKSPEASEISTTDDETIGNITSKTEKEPSPIAASPGSTQREVNSSRESLSPVIPVTFKEDKDSKTLEETLKPTETQDRTSSDMSEVSGKEDQYESPEVCESVSLIESEALFSESVDPELDKTMEGEKENVNLSQSSDHQFSDADDDEFFIPTSQPVLTNTGRRPAGLGGVGLAPRPPVAGAFMRGRQPFTSSPRNSFTGSVNVTSTVPRSFQKRQLSSSDEESVPMESFKKPRVDCTTATSTGRSLSLQASRSRKLGKRPLEESCESLAKRTNDRDQPSGKDPDVHGDFFELVESVNPITEAEPKRDPGPCQPSGQGHEGLDTKTTSECNSHLSDIGATNSEKIHIETTPTFDCGIGASICNGVKIGTNSKDTEGHGEDAMLTEVNYEKNYTTSRENISGVNTTVPNVPTGHGEDRQKLSYVVTVETEAGSIPELVSKEMDAEPSDVINSHKVVVDATAAGPDAGSSLFKASVESINPTSSTYELDFKDVKVVAAEVNEVVDPDVTTTSVMAIEAPLANTNLEDRESTVQCTESIEDTDCTSTAETEIKQAKREAEVLPQVDTAENITDALVEASTPSEVISQDQEEREVKNACNSSESESQLSCEEEPVFDDSINPDMDDEKIEVSVHEDSVDEDDFQLLIEPSQAFSPSSEPSPEESDTFIADENTVTNSTTMEEETCQLDEVRNETKIADSEVCEISGLILTPDAAQGCLPDVLLTDIPPPYSDQLEQVFEGDPEDKIDHPDVLEGESMGDDVSASNGTNQEIAKPLSTPEDGCDKLSMICDSASNTNLDVRDGDKPVAEDHTESCDSSTPKMYTFVDHSYCGGTDSCKGTAGNIPVENMQNDVNMKPKSIEESNVLSEPVVSFGDSCEPADSLDNSDRTDAEAVRMIQKGTEGCPTKEDVNDDRVNITKQDGGAEVREPIVESQSLFSEPFASLPETDDLDLECTLPLEENIEDDSESRREAEKEDLVDSEELHCSLPSDVDYHSDNGDDCNYLETSINDLEVLNDKRYLHDKIAGGISHVAEVEARNDLERGATRDSGLCGGDQTLPHVREVIKGNQEVEEIDVTSMGLETLKKDKNIGRNLECPPDSERSPDVSTLLYDSSLEVNDTHDCSSRGKLNETTVDYGDEGHADTADLGTVVNASQVSEEDIFSQDYGLSQGLTSPVIPDFSAGLREQGIISSTPLAFNLANDHDSGHIDVRNTTGKRGTTSQENAGIEGPLFDDEEGFSAPEVNFDALMSQSDEENGEIRSEAVPSSQVSSDEEPCSPVVATMTLAERTAQANGREADIDDCKEMDTFEPAPVSFDDDDDDAIDDDEVPSPTVVSSRNLSHYTTDSHSDDEMAGPSGLDQSETTGGKEAEKMYSSDDLENDSLDPDSPEVVSCSVKRKRNACDEHRTNYSDSDDEFSDPLSTMVSPVFKPSFKTSPRRLSDSFERKPLEIKPVVNVEMEDKKPDLKKRPRKLSEDYSMPVSFDTDDDENIPSTCPVTYQPPRQEEEALFSSQPVTKKRKIAAALERLSNKYGKIEMTRDSESPSLDVPSDSPRGSQETPSQLPPAGQTRRQIFPPQAALSVTQTLRRTEDLLKELKDCLGDTRVGSTERIAAWSKEIADLKENLKLPTTTIAVVGDTGAGKSSLMNALLDHASIIPTSGIRACTAVVVDITNSTSRRYEADIEFLSKKEWYDELDMLLRMLPTKDGKVICKEPNRDTQPDAAAAFAKVKAVYGPAFKAGVTRKQLQADNTITRWLGKVRTESHHEPLPFRGLVTKYIESTECECQWWPIVKKVSLRIPNCEVCSSGATLVDLPGIKDSNAARDRIAKDHLKNCNAVWVVANIQRAVDLKTAKKLLGEHFRRQLLMDGQYGAVSFVCTKTDDLVPSEIIRNLELDDNMFTVKMVELRRKRSEVDKKLRENEKAKKKRESEISEMKQDLKEDEELLDSLLNVDEDEIDTEVAFQVRRLEQVIKGKQEELKLRQEKLTMLELVGRDVLHQKFEIEKSEQMQQKKRSLFCAKERNAFAAKEIQRDFTAGIKEMYRKSRGVASDDEESDDEDDEREAENRGTQLKVFCVSAVDYLKVTRLLDDDGQSNVFENEEDTGIPVLRRFVHEMTKEHQEKSVKKMVALTYQLIMAIHTYMRDQGTEDTKLRENVRNHILDRFQACETKLQNRCVESVSSEIDRLYNETLQPKVKQGKGEAINKAPATVTRWGQRPNPNQKELGGYCYAVYKAIMRRAGEYKSDAAGKVDMNEDLSSPAYDKISVVWNQVFNRQISEVLASFARGVTRSICAFVDDLAKELERLGIPPNRLQPLRNQIAMTATTQLSQNVEEVLEFVRSQQRDINRVITVIVKDQMIPAYNACEAEQGKGQFERMKNIMMKHVDSQRAVMFDKASMELLGNLDQLKDQILDVLRLIIRELIKKLKILYEPLWTCPTNNKEVQDAMLPGVAKILRRCKLLAVEVGVNLSQRLSEASQASSTGGRTGNVRSDDPRSSGTGQASSVSVGTDVDNPRPSTSSARNDSSKENNDDENRSTSPDLTSTCSRSSSPEYDLEVDYVFQNRPKMPAAQKLKSDKEKPVSPNLKSKLSRKRSFLSDSRSSSPLQLGRVKGEQTPSTSMKLATVAETLGDKTSTGPSCSAVLASFAKVANKKASAEALQSRSIVTPDHSQAQKRPRLDGSGSSLTEAREFPTVQTQFGGQRASNIQLQEVASAPKHSSSSQQGLQMRNELEEGKPCALQELKLEHNTPAAVLRSAENVRGHHAGRQQHPSHGYAQGTLPGRKPDTRSNPQNQLQSRAPMRISQGPSSSVSVPPRSKEMVRAQAGAVQHAVGSAQRLVPIGGTAHPMKSLLESSTTAAVKGRGKTLPVTPGSSYSGQAGDQQGPLKATVKSQQVSSPFSTVRSLLAVPAERRPVLKDTVRSIETAATSRQRLPLSQGVSTNLQGQMQVPSSIQGQLKPVQFVSSVGIVSKTLSEGVTASKRQKLGPTFPQVLPRTDQSRGHTIQTQGQSHSGSALSQGQIRSHPHSQSQGHSVQTQGQNHSGSVLSQGQVRSLISQSQAQGQVRSLISQSQAQGRSGHNEGQTQPGLLLPQGQVRSLQSQVQRHQQSQSPGKSQSGVKRIPLRIGRSGGNVIQGQATSRSGSNVVQGQATPQGQRVMYSQSQRFLQPQGRGRARGRGSGPENVLNVSALETIKQITGPVIQRVVQRTIQNKQSKGGKP